MRSSSDGGSLVKFRIDAQGKLAGEMLSRINAILSAGVEKYLQGNLTLAAQTIDILRIEISSTIQPDKLPPEHLNIRVE